jgi:hypothetical protein
MVLAGALLAVALVFALITGVAGAAKHGPGGNSKNAKKCQGTGYLNWTTTSGTAFDSADACTAYAAQGGTLTPKPVTHRLTVTVVGRAGTPAEGRVTSDPAGIDCVAMPGQFNVCDHDFTAGTTVTLTEQPLGGSFLIGWSGACSGRDTTCTVTLDSDTQVEADFNEAG